MLRFSALFLPTSVLPVDLALMLMCCAVVLYGACWALCSFAYAFFLLLQDSPLGYPTTSNSTVAQVHETESLSYHPS